jgi:hypothetical protein
VSLARRVRQRGYSVKFRIAQILETPSHLGSSMSLSGAGRGRSHPAHRPRIGSTRKSARFSDTPTDLTDAPWGDLALRMSAPTRRGPPSTLRQQSRRLMNERIGAQRLASGQHSRASNHGGRDKSAAVDTSKSWCRHGQRSPGGPRHEKGVPIRLVHDVTLLIAGRVSARESPSRKASTPGSTRLSEAQPTGQGSSGSMERRARRRFSR